ncbi:hypothetical protein [Streptomyces violascens]|uniref:Uncharacterized protein n=1 Tax=Streptomyces violascens TaxID=67381 RepID=A0ABQ3QX84_9ACTN|nr:hypothetical protein [Streptomyces violascens]GGU13057.1 hypothetical protein GCM10010289_38360 [Streptomyces violascens]GHI41886.1 hypothetical protein Sviol_62940 [Streptomyces violascens]
MTRREPTIHNPALMIQCPRCDCVAGAPCLDTRGSRLRDGRVHLARTAAHRRREAARKPREAGR